MSICVIARNFGQPLVPIPRQMDGNCGSSTLMTWQLKSTPSSREGWPNSWWMMWLAVGTPHAGGAWGARETWEVAPGPATSPVEKNHDFREGGGCATRSCHLLGQAGHLAVQSSWGQDVRSDGLRPAARHPDSKNQPLGRRDWWNWC